MLILMGKSKLYIFWCWYLWGKNFTCKIWVKKYFSRDAQRRGGKPTHPTGCIISVSTQPRWRLAYGQSRLGGGAGFLGFAPCETPTGWNYFLTQILHVKFFPHKYEHQKKVKFGFPHKYQHHVKLKNLFFDPEYFTPCIKEYFTKICFTRFQGDEIQGFNMGTFASRRRWEKKYFLTQNILHMLKCFFPISISIKKSKVWISP